ncbi:MAG: aromatic ring-hydroxylating dioxygenase subunit alpha [Steroidobacteraceae bacterium]
MAVNYKVEWPMTLNAPRNSLEAKQPEIDNGLDVPDPSRYYSSEFMRKEWQNLWPRVWLLAGVTADLQEAGDYFTFRIGPEEFIVVKQPDGAIKAFYNVCPHRGNRVCQNERGSVDRFTCGFHGWQFGCDGKLQKISDEKTFNPRLIAHRPGLTEVRCETLGGIVFINMDGKAPPLAQYLGLPKGYIEMYEIDKMHVVHHVLTEWRANWKTGVDAFYETYHLPYVHPQTQGVMEDFSQYDLYPNGASRMIVPICVKSHRVGDQDTVDDYLKFMLKEGGIDPAAFNGTAREVRAAIQRSKRARAQRVGLAHYENFSDGQLTDSWATGLFPNVQMGMHPEGVFIMRFLPHATDPEVFYYETMILYRHVEDPDYTVPAWMGLPAGIDVTGATRPNCINVPPGDPPNLGDVLDQDSELLPVQQQGIRSRAFKGPLWGEQEQRLRHFHRELDRYLNDEK